MGGVGRLPQGSPAPFGGWGFSPRGGAFAPRGNWLKAHLKNRREPWAIRPLDPSVISEPAPGLPYVLDIHSALPCLSFDRWEGVVSLCSATLTVVPEIGINKERALSVYAVLPELRRHY